MIKDEVTYRLAKAYINEARKHGLYLFSMKTVDRSKWWIHFERAAGYRYTVDWTPEDHVRSCFEKFGKILPFRLFGKTALEAWEEYHHRYKGKQGNDYVVQMLDTYKKMKKQYGKYCSEFYEKNRYQLQRNSFSVHFLCLSTEFRKMNEIENYFDKDVLNVKRQIVHTNKKVWGKMEELFGDDFY